jgi:G:T-mismatch repair DNA endonuclease (very short patch repair protein)
LVFICNGQNNDDLSNKKVRITTEKSNIESVLIELVKRYGISFSHEPREIPLKKEVKLPKEEMILKDVLDIL